MFITNTEPLKFCLAEKFTETSCAARCDSVSIVWGNKCTCAKIAVQVDNKETVNTYDVDSDSALIREVEEALQKAHLTLSPQKTKKEPISVDRPSKSVLKMCHGNTCIKKSRPDSSGPITKQRKYIPAHYKAPYKTDLHIPNRNLLCHPASTCDCYQYQTHQQAALIEKYNKSVSCLWLSISRILISSYLLITNLYVDVQKVSQDEINWIQYVFSRFSLILKLLELLMTKVNPDSSDLSTTNVLNGLLTHNDPISAWFASKHPVKLVAPPSPYEAFLTIGNCPSTPGAFSRLLALTAWPQMCVFNGSAKQALLFTNLWSELESVQTELELLNTFKANLPNLLVDHLFTKTINHASAFRNLYTLVCGNSPLILKSNV
ncbi:uncharacterized protein DC041_0011568 [Schistosoma bovis]|uniref:Uncharacterized protein n=1 Tax=Schistosoma bovis TaxID=6184 RepID=A0A430QAP1_SCHBO|nr:uncharacterized protein DC041_0011568 [Schistosoma bovis]